MVCLSPEQLAQFALGIEVDAVSATHVEQCADCQAELVSLQALTDRLSVAHSELQRGHEDARRRLLANIPDVDRQSQPSNVWQKLSHWYGDLNMIQRVALSSVSLVVVLGLIAVWAAVTTQPASATEKMRESISRAKSCKSTTKLEVMLRPGQEPAISTISATSYWLPSGATRIEMKGNRDLWYMDVTYILPPGDPGIELEHRNKEFRRGPAVKKNSSTMTMLERLSKYSGKADRDLGTKMIGGKRGLRFRNRHQEA